MKLFDNSRYSDRLNLVSCCIPTTNYHVTENGDVFNCCPGWLPTPIGNLFDQSVLEMMNGEVSKKIRDSVADGSYKFCDADVCPYISKFVHSNSAAPAGPLVLKSSAVELTRLPIVLLLDYDKSCNLYCGSCRNERVIYTLENFPPRLKQLHERVVSSVTELVAMGLKVNVHITGSGDGFASPFYWHFLKNISGHENFEIRLTTNGTLMTPERLLFPFSQMLNYVEVSVDAATEETYTKVRRGGNFKNLTQNLIHLDRLIAEGNLKNLQNWNVNFVVQNDNFLEMEMFAQWALAFKSVNQIWFHLVQKWAHMSPENFDKMAVWKPEHPDFKSFLQVLKNPIFDHPKINLGNLSQYRA